MPAVSGPQKAADEQISDILATQQGIARVLDENELADAIMAVSFMDAVQRCDNRLD
jgi:hypothetical protein